MSKQTRERMGTDTVLTPPEQDLRPKVTPELVIVSTTGRSPAVAATLARKMGDDAAKLPELYARKDGDGIRRLIAAAERPSTPANSTPAPQPITPTN